MFVVCVENAKSDDGGGAAGAANSHRIHSLSQQISMRTTHSGISIVNVVTIIP